MRLAGYLLVAGSLLGGCSDGKPDLRSGGTIPPTSTITQDEPTVEPPVAPPKVFAVGEIATSTEIEAIVLEVDKKITLSEYDSVDKGRVLFAIRVRIKNLTVADGVTANSAEWAIEDAEGQAYESHCCSSNNEPELPLRELQPGEQATGWITFEVPPSGLLLATWSPGLETIARFRVR